MDSEGAAHEKTEVRSIDGKPLLHIARICPVRYHHGHRQQPDRAERAGNAARKRCRMRCAEEGTEQCPAAYSCSRTNAPSGCTRFARTGHAHTSREDMLRSIHSHRGRAMIIYDSLLTFAAALDQRVGDFDYFTITDILMYFPSRVLVTALIYFKRYMKRSTRGVESVQLYLKTFFSCVVIGSKYIDDRSIRLEDICILLRIPKCSIILPMEMHVLSVLGFDLQIEDREYTGVIDSIVLSCRVWPPEV